MAHGGGGRWVVVGMKADKSWGRTRMRRRMATAAKMLNR